MITGKPLHRTSIHPNPIQRWHRQRACNPHAAHTSSITANHLSFAISIFYTHPCLPRHHTLLYQPFTRKYLHPLTSKSTNYRARKKVREPWSWDLPYGGDSGSCDDRALRAPPPLPAGRSIPWNIREPPCRLVGTLTPIRLPYSLIYTWLTWVTLYDLISIALTFNVLKYVKRSCDSINFLGTKTSIFYHFFLFHRFYLPLCIANWWLRGEYNFSKSIFG